MDFVAIDFETATSNYTSVCSLGICVVENNKITDRKEILIKPEPFEFNDYNIKNTRNYTRYGCEQAYACGLLG